MKIKNAMLKGIRYCSRLSDIIGENHIFAYASQASFFVIISSVPFLMVILNILSVAMPIDEAYFNEFIKNFLPSQMHNIAFSMADEFYQKINISVVSITTVFLIWSASRGVRAISYGLRMAFGTNGNEGYIKIFCFSLLYTVLFTISITLTAVILAFGSHFASFLSERAPAFKTIIGIIFNLRYLIFLIFLTLVFMSAYKFLGKTKIKFTKLFPGALLSALFWLVFSFCYSLYISNFSRFSYIYGSLAGVIFIMLWLWFCMISLILGAQVNQWLFEKKLSFLALIKQLANEFTKS